MGTSLKKRIRGLYKYFRLPVEYSLVRDQAGVWTRVAYPSTEQLLESSYYLMGGHVDNNLPANYRDELLALGYVFATVTPPVMVDPGTEAELGYGAGGYGAGTYGDVGETSSSSAGGTSGDAGYGDGPYGQGPYGE